MYQNIMTVDQMRVMSYHTFFPFSIIDEINCQMHTCFCFCSHDDIAGTFTFLHTNFNFILIYSVKFSVIKKYSSNDWQLNARLQLDLLWSKEAKLTMKHMCTVPVTYAYITHHHTRTA